MPVGLPAAGVTVHKRHTQRGRPGITVALPAEVRPKPMFRTMTRYIGGVLSSRCPHCKSIEFRSVGVRNIIEAACLWLLLPFRCDFCGRHFFLFRWQVPTVSAT